LASHISSYAIRVFWKNLDLKHMDKKQVTWGAVKEEVKKVSMVDMLSIQE
jgi:hypothetical protein